MDPRLLERLCAGFRRRLRMFQVQSGLARVALCGLLLLILSVALDAWMHLASGWRLLTLAAWAAGMGAAAWWTLLLPLRRRWSNLEILRYVDSTSPPGRAMLLDLYELTTARDAIAEAQTAEGQALAEQAAESLTTLPAQIRLGEALQQRRSLRWVAAAGVLFALLAAAALSPGTGTYAAVGFERFFNPFSDRYWPSRTVVAVQEPAEGWMVPQLEAKEIRATVTGEIPDTVTLSYRSPSSDYWIREKVAVRDGAPAEDGTPAGAVSFTFPEVRESLRFYIEGGDFVTREYAIGIVDRPFLKSIAAHYSYPPYAGLPERDVPSGQVQGLEGTRVALRFESNMPLEKAQIVFRDADDPARARREVLGFDGESRTAFSKTLMLERSGSYTVELFEPNGFREARPEVYEIRVEPDLKPEIELVAPADRALAMTHNGSFDVAFRAKDDFGIAEMKFFVQNGAGEPVALTPRVTGPIPQEGRNPPPVYFNLDLRKLGVPKEGKLKFWAFVRDVNPTGKGVAMTDPGEVQIVKPSEFHSRMLMRARKIIDEASIAWSQQLEAWRQTRDWLKDGGGAESDSRWAALAERQKKSIRAAVASEMHLRELEDAYRSNRMAMEFMSGRVDAIARLMDALNEQHHAAVDAALLRAVPRTDADAEPAALKARREGALAATSRLGFSAAEHQKLALLHLERILRKLYDWEDFQTAVVRATLLEEEQQAILAASKEIGTRHIGADPNDLPDDAVETLKTLGKRQAVAADAEQSLEEMLAFFEYKAEVQQRMETRAPMHVAYTELRDRRIQDGLKRAAAQIALNQAIAIVPEQEAAIAALAFVRAGLELAGKKAAPDREIALSDTPVTEADWTDVKPREKEPQTPGTGDPSVEVASESALDAIKKRMDRLREGEDAVSVAVQGAVTVLGQVISQTHYLEKNRGPQEMPRYVYLSSGILCELHAAYEYAVDFAVHAVEKSPQSDREALAAAGREAVQSAELLRAGDTSLGTEQLQTDSRTFLLDFLQLLARRKKAAEAVAANRAGGGLDAHKQKFLYRDANLDALDALFADLNEALLLQSAVAARLERFEKFPAGNERGGVRARLEAANRTRAAQAQARVAGLLSATKAKLSAIVTPAYDEEKELAEDLVKRANDAGLREALELDLSRAAASIAAGTQPAADQAQARAAGVALAGAVTGVMDLFEALVQPRPRELAQGPDAPPAEPIDPEEWKRNMTPVEIGKRLEKATNLPPEVRVRMLRALQRDFEGPYKQLLAMYYLSFLEEEAAK